jgi:hypothetical protein
MIKLRKQLKSLENGSARPDVSSIRRAFLFPLQEGAPP